MGLKLSRVTIFLLLGLSKVVTILGDTRKCHASVRLAVNADVLVHEATYGKGDEKIARKHGHSTNMEAAQVAKDAGVSGSCLIISVHDFYPRILVNYGKMQVLFSSRFILSRI